MKTRSLREMTRTRDVKLGHFIVEFATPGIGHLIRSAGCEFVFLDMEHSGFSFETVKSTIRYLEAAEIRTMVRVPSQEYHHIARACDMGAEGLIAPMVSTPGQAKKILDSMRYYPMGARGVALGIAHDNYRTGAVKDKFKAANERNTFFCLIETAEGVENADAIARIDGVDCLWIGHFDLSVSLGIPGEFDNPKFLKAIDTLRAAAKKRNKSMGRMTGSVQQGIELFNQGFDFMCYSGDIWVFQQALTEAITKLREGCVLKRGKK
ncbi:aldolase/citrate lyase family protein [soil metagenome]